MYEEFPDSCGFQYPEGTEFYTPQCGIPSYGTKRRIFSRYTKILIFLQLIWLNKPVYDEGCGPGHPVYFKSQKKTRFQIMVGTFEHGGFDGTFGWV